MRKILIMLFITLLCNSFLYSQAGKIRGKVIDKGSGETLIMASIVVVGSNPLIGAASDFDGNFSLENIPSGTYNIQFSMVSYETKTIEGVIVKDDEVTLLNVSLGEASLGLEEVVIKATAVRNTETALMTMQRKSATVVDGISSQQIRRLGDSNAAGAIKRVTGVSVQDGKYVYVRGLSDRYMKTTLNGAEIPGLDPEVNSVQMDLFPSNIIENMLVHKTFSPDLPTFTGGHIDIITKDFPEKFTMQFSATFGFNPGSSLNKDYRYYEGGATDWLGYDDGTRDMPEVAKNQLPAVYTASDSLTAISQAFNRIMETRTKRSGIDQSYSFSIGNQVSMFGKPLGFIATVSYKNEYDFYVDNYTRYLGTDLKTASKKIDLDRDCGKNTATWSAMGGLSYKLSNNHKISLLGSRNQSGTSGAKYCFGNEPEEATYVRWELLEYLQRSITAVQLQGKHVFAVLNNTTIEWQASYILSTQDEPDMRFWYNDYNTDTEVHSFRKNKKPFRSYREMWEENYDNCVHVTVPFRINGAKSKLKIGGTYIKKYRDSDEAQFTLNYQGSFGALSSSPYDILDPENFVQGSTFLYYTNSDLTNDYVSYRGDEKNLSGYAMLDLQLTSKLRVVIGAKIEKGEVFIENKVVADTSVVVVNGEEVEAWKVAYPNESSSTTVFNKYDYGEYDETDMLPSFNLTYSIIENMNLRFAYSRSISRPAFREIAPYSYYDLQVSERFVGNPDLERGLIDNFDLRWEYFFKNGEMLSLSGFYKNLEKPIERYVDPTSGDNTENKYKNGNDATVYGVEIEIREKLDFVSALKNFTIGGNVTLVKSIVTEDSSRMVDYIWKEDSAYSDERAMFGQSPYIINAFLNYDNSANGISSSVGFNMSGKKIILLGGGVTPDVYQLPVPQLDFSISKSIKKGFTFKFRVKNILDPNITRKYIRDDYEYDYSDYQKGRTFSLGITYKI